jgi:proteasome accessory factor B
MMTIDQAVRAGEWPNATRLAARLEVDVRTIRRDISYMRDQLGAPLVYSARKGGYEYTQPSYRLPFFQVTEGELLALLLAQRVLGQFRGTPFEAELARIFDRLTHLLSDTVSIALDEMADCVAVLPPVVTPLKPEVFATLAEALVERRCVRVTYHTLDRDTETTRTWRPYHLVLRGDDWYVLAHDSLREGVRIFALQRIRAVQLLEERFDRPKDFRVDEYMGIAFRAIPGDGLTRHEVVLRFRPPSAQRIAEKIWHPSQILEREGDQVVLRLQVGDLREIKRWVMFWGSDCEVLGPEELRASLRLEVESLRKSLSPP